MADKSVSQNFSENPDPQEKPVSGDDITHPQEQLKPQLGVRLSDRTPQSLIEWLARINRRYLALDQEKLKTQAKRKTCSGLEVTIDLIHLAMDIPTKSNFFDYERIESNE